MGIYKLALKYRDKRLLPLFSNLGELKFFPEISQVDNKNNEDALYIMNGVLPNSIREPIYSVLENQEKRTFIITELNSVANQIEQVKQEESSTTQALTKSLGYAPLPEPLYTEPNHNIDNSNLDHYTYFKDLLDTRHSAIKFKTEVKIPQEDIEKAIKLVKNTPSTYNLQGTRYIVITDEGIKEQIYKICNEQYKIHSASALVLGVGKLHPYQNFDSIYTPMKELGMIDDSECKIQKDYIKGWYAQLSEDKLKEDVIRNGVVGMTTIMYSFQSLGWDSCPMHILNYDKVQKLLKIPTDYYPVLMLAVGKSVEDRKRPRGYRLPVDEVVHYNSF